MYKLSLCEPQILKTDTPESQIAQSEYVTLSHLGFVDLELGDMQERYRLLSRIAEGSWQAVRLEKNRLSANFQGNPLWPEKALQRFPHLLRHFGLSKSSTENLCLIPTSETVNNKLSQLLDHDFKFESRQPESEKEYVDRFIDLRRLPMADYLDRDSVHDWSYHFLTFLFGEYLENVRVSLEFIRDNMDVFAGEVVRHWNYYGHSLVDGKMQGSARSEVVSHSEAIYRQMAISLDVSTAKIVQLLCLKEKGLLEKCQSEVRFLEIFLSPLNEDMLRKHLWLEENLDALVDRLPKSKVRILDNRGLENYLESKLEELEVRAAKNANPNQVVQREGIFREILAAKPSPQALESRLEYP